MKVTRMVWSGGKGGETQVESKKHRLIDREMTTPLFLLRCVQFGLSMDEPDLLTIGLVNDMFTEHENDDFDGWHEVAGQADFDAF